MLLSMQGQRVYYHRIVVERESQQEDKEAILVKCGWMPPVQRAKRADQLSPDFVEDEYKFIFDFNPIN